jgi:hypothetical protein
LKSHVILLVSSGVRWCATCDRSTKILKPDSGAIDPPFSPRPTRGTRARDLRVIAGNRERLVGVLQQRYGAHRRTIEREVRAFTRAIESAAVPAGSAVEPPQVT